MIRMELLVDEIHGRYIGQVLAERYGDALEGVLLKELEILRKGPNEEGYWETLDDVLDDATLDGMHLCYYEGNIFVGILDESASDEEDEDYSGE